MSILKYSIIITFVVLFIFIILMVTNNLPFTYSLDPLEIEFNDYNKPKKAWYGTYSAEKEECFKYGGGWSSGSDSCSKGWGAPFNEDGTCPQDHTNVEFTYPYEGSGCLETEYVDNAQCEKYWRIVWNQQGFGCSKLGKEEISILQNEEILENQEVIKNYLSDLYDLES